MKQLRKTAFAACFVWNSLTLGKTNTPLYKNQDHAEPLQLVQHAEAKHASRYKDVSGPVIVPETLDKGFWYGLFDVGNAHNLSLIIDTGSPAVGIDPDKYKPSSASKDLNSSLTIQYITALENGCGVANISGEEYSDRVSVAGLVAQDHRFYKIVKKTPPNNETLTQLPHDGVVGLDNVEYGGDFGRPLFSQLCKQGQVKACRFGLALGTKGGGEQVWGAVDSELFHGKLSRSPVENEWSVNGSVSANSQVLIRNATIVLDSGTAGVRSFCLIEVAKNGR